MIRVACYGLGEIGLAIARVAGRHSQLEVVAAIDVAPDKAGSTLGDLRVRGEASNVVVSADAAYTLADTEPDVVLLSTTSKMLSIVDQIAGCLEAGAAVVSTCEELAYPWGRAGAERIDQAAMEAGRAVVGTGVNPGFVMDFLPAILSNASTDIRNVSVKRSIDLNRRRQALREKAGVGMSAEQFEKLASEHAIGHVGLDSSVRLVAHALGLQVDPMSVSLTPLVEDGTVHGFEQHALHPSQVGRPGIELTLLMSTKLAEAEADRIHINGDPPLDVELRGGLFGDTATAAIAVNTVPHVLNVSPGLKTVLDLPLGNGWSGLSRWSGR